MEMSSDSDLLVAVLLCFVFDQTFIFLGYNPHLEILKTFGQTGNLEKGRTEPDLSSDCSPKDGCGLVGVFLPSQKVPGARVKQKE